MCQVERGLRREKLTFTTVDHQEFLPCSGCVSIDF